VGTETLICGTTGVGVKASVAVSVGDGVDVDVGVKVGSSGVNVSVGSCKVGGNVSDRAAWTNPAITVCAAAVLIAPESCNVIAGKAQAKTTIDKMMIVKVIRPVGSIVPPNKLGFQPCKESPTSLGCWAGSSLHPFFGIIFKTVKIFVLFQNSPPALSGLRH